MNFIMIQFDYNEIYNYNNYILYLIILTNYLKIKNLKYKTFKPLNIILKYSLLLILEIFYL